MAHSHNHTNSQSNFNKAFIIGIILNIAYVAIEFTYGIIIQSLALVADAGHNLSDVLGLLLAWGASYLVTKAPTKQRTYGFKRSSILAALFNAIILMVAVGAIAWEAIKRINNPEAVPGTTVMIVAGIGVIVNTVTALLFVKGRKEDLNIKGAFLHMAADAAISVGVVVAGFIILKTGLQWIDPVVSLIIVIIITIGTWSLLKDSFNLAMDAVPEGIDPVEVKKYLQRLEGVEEVHDLHIWAMSTTESALTVHLVKPDSDIDDGFTSSICKELYNKFGIQHTTIQIEHGKGTQPCGLASDNTV